MDEFSKENKGKRVLVESSVSQAKLVFDRVYNYLTFNEFNENVAEVYEKFEWRLKNDLEFTEKFFDCFLEKANLEEDEGKRMVNSFIKKIVVFDDLAKIENMNDLFDFVTLRISQVISKVHNVKKICLKKYREIQ